MSAPGVGTRTRTSSSAETFTTAPRDLSAAATTGLRRSAGGRGSARGSAARSLRRGDPGEEEERDGAAEGRAGPHCYSSSSVSTCSTSDSTGTAWSATSGRDLR